MEMHKALHSAAPWALTVVAKVCATGEHGVIAADLSALQCPLCSNCTCSGSDIHILIDKKLKRQVNKFTMEILMHYLAQCLSIVTIASCCILKVPQILSIYEKKSTVGIKLPPLLLELISYTTTTLYNYLNDYSALTYLEYPIILAQQMVLIFFTLKYSHQLNSERTRFSFVCYWLVVLAFLVRAMPTYILTYLVPLGTPVSGASKCMYIYAMMQAQSSETTSLLTWLISIATNLFRIFTVQMDSADRNLLFNFFISTILSTGVLLTAIYYKNNPGTDTQNRSHQN